jgi:two-component system, NtrC family, sensor kinase
MDSPSAGREPDFFAFLHRTTSQLESAREADKVLRHYLRACVAFFGADAGCVTAADPGGLGVEIRHSQPAEVSWDHRFLAALVAERRPEFPRGFICATLVRRGRPWGVIALRRDAGRFERWQEKSLHPVAREISRLLDHVDRERLAEVRARIDHKIMRELAPKDLYYQILDGLHQLTRYDHSASLYILEPGAQGLKLVAEQIAWRKMKSERIGVAVELTDEIAPFLGGGLVYGFDRRATGWREWTARGATALAEALEPRVAASGSGDSNRTAGDPAENATGVSVVSAMLLAPLGTQGGAVGLLCLRALRPFWFGPYEGEVLGRFAGVVSLVLQRSRALESMQERMLLIERSTTLAHLARGVAHDINNALGAVAPLVQQMQSELEEGKTDPTAWRDDLARIESSIEVCRRIFSGMLRMARGASRHDGTCDLRRAVETSMDVLRESLSRQGVRLEIDVPADLVPVRGGQEDVERVILNLATNAREAMSAGGLLRIEADQVEERVRLRIRDTGHGIPEGLIRQIDKPFFSTKPEGWGLGLPTCRSIVSEIGGEMMIDGAPGRGTLVTVLLKPALVREMAS